MLATAGHRSPALTGSLTCNAGSSRSVVPPGVASRASQACEPEHAPTQGLRVGSDTDELVQERELCVVGNFCLGEVPHDLIDAEFGGPEQVALDLVHGPGQRRAIGVV